MGLAKLVRPALPLRASPKPFHPMQKTTLPGELQTSALRRFPVQTIGPSTWLRATALAVVLAFVCITSKAVTPEDLDRDPILKRGVQTRLAINLLHPKDGDVFSGPHYAASEGRMRMLVPRDSWQQMNEDVRNAVGHYLRWSIRDARTNPDQYVRPAGKKDSPAVKEEAAKARTLNVWDWQIVVCDKGKNGKWKPAEVVAEGKAKTEAKQ